MHHRVCFRLETLSRGSCSASWVLSRKGPTSVGRVIWAIDWNTFHSIIGENTDTAWAYTAKTVNWRLEIELSLLRPSTKRVWFRMDVRMLFSPENTAHS